MITLCEQAFVRKRRTLLGKKLCCIILFNPLCGYYVLFLIYFFQNFFYLTYTRLTMNFFGGCSTLHKLQLGSQTAALYPDMAKCFHVKGHVIGFICNIYSIEQFVNW